MSKDETNYETLIKILSLYRLTLEQARQEELNYEVMRFPSDDERGYYDQAYNAIARKDDCVLLPRPARRKG